MKQFGLSKKECLLRPFQYKNVYQSRRLKKSKLVWLYTMPNGLEYNRLGISASKKVCINNVTRNRVKRLIRQSYQLNKALFGRGNDIVIVAKQLPKTIDLEVFNKAITAALKHENNNIKTN
jgi:ribonuclease P protein component